MTGEGNGARSACIFCSPRSDLLGSNELAVAFRAGYPVTVDARCTYPVGDLGLPGVPGSVRVSSSFTSPVDPNRGVQ